MTTNRYRSLDPVQIVETVARLRDRIRERFPEANLVRVAEELHHVAADAARRNEEIRRPNLWLRAVSLFLLGVGAVALVGAVMAVHPHLDDDWRVAEVIQTLEASLGALFFLGAGIVLVASLEARAKRSRCLTAVHEMRAMAHIVDMHQLTKDPERSPEEAEQDTPSSPKRKLTRFQLVRYLDYCSELLSLIGKVAAVYVQGFNDPQARDAVDEVESLTTGLSRKIWQKIMILDQSGFAAAPRSVRESESGADGAA